MCTCVYVYVCACAPTATNGIIYYASLTANSCNELIIRALSGKRPWSGWKRMVLHGRGNGVMNLLKRHWHNRREVSAIGVCLLQSDTNTHTHTYAHKYLYMSTYIYEYGYYGAFMLCQLARITLHILVACTAPTHFPRHCSNNFACESATKCGCVCLCVCASLCHILLRSNAYNHPVALHIRGSYASVCIRFWIDV